jgi:hypothetical protein
MIGLNPTRRLTFLAQVRRYGREDFGLNDRRCLEKHCLMLLL